MNGYDEQKDAENRRRCYCSYHYSHDGYFYDSSRGHTVMCVQGSRYDSRNAGLHKTECVAEQPAKLTPGQTQVHGDRVTAQVLMTGSAALSAAGRLMKERRGEMERQFPSFFHAVFDTETTAEGVRIPMLAALENHRAKLPEALRIAEDNGCLFCREVGREGVLRSLWKMGEELGFGMEIHIKKIPVRQETIEICEYYDLDPYEEESEGALMIAVSDCGGLACALERAGIPVSAIGFLHTGKARTIVYPGHVRYLDKARGER